MVCSDTKYGVQLATWNCQTGLTSNWKRLNSLDADVITVQECGAETAAQAQRHGWMCEYQEGHYGKGLVVLARRHYKIERREQSLRFAVSTVISGPGESRFRFVGFWAMTPKAVGFSYTHQATMLIDALPQDGLPTVVAGDFNASRSDAHLKNVGRLRALSLVSAYHKFNGQEHTRKEPDATSYFLWQRSRPYHMDFVFVPGSWRINSVYIGTFEEYTRSGLSDHVPIVVAITPE